MKNIYNVEVACFFRKLLAWHKVAAFHRTVEKQKLWRSKPKQGRGLDIFDFYSTKVTNGFWESKRFINV
jgi:hypothetical protein